ncbi:MAG: tripartite tricarboxylate transporter TctB family protein [Syntrophales bacterium LBB04]|nr:tripartite tricarboxylate transporter TctB family protein [Syntrophales bacterium LBB04]
MVKKNAGFWVGLIIFLFSLLYFITSFQYDYVTGFGPGPGMLPRWLSAFMAVLALLYIVESIRHPISVRSILPQKKAALENVVIISYLLLFVCIVEYTGFSVASTVLLFLLLRGQFRWFVTLGISGGSSAFLFWLFGVMLKVPLPVNQFGW